MQIKSPITNYLYIQYLVENIKTLQAEGKNFDWYFNELLQIYDPLIAATAARIKRSLHIRISIQDLRARVMLVFFDSVLKYTMEYKDKDLKTEDKEVFSHVYFSRYLKTRMPWEVMRILIPPRKAHDDFQIDDRLVPLNPKKCSPILEKKFSYTHKVMADENFVSLCRFVQRCLKNDLLSDIMMLCYGYDFRNLEMANLMGISQQKIGLALLELKQFWRDNEDLLR